MAQHPRRQSSLYSPPWEPEISPCCNVCWMTNAILELNSDNVPPRMMTG
jgi:hypothetical protein